MATQVIARLILVLLLAAFSMPAASASCHTYPPTAGTARGTMHGGHGTPDRRPDEATVHACIGCVPPSDLIAPAVAPPSFGADVPPRARDAASVAGLDRAPALPPPRAG